MSFSSQTALLTPLPQCSGEGLILSFVRVPVSPPTACLHVVPPLPQEGMKFLANSTMWEDDRERSGFPLWVAGEVITAVGQWVHVPGRVVSTGQVRLDL